MEKMLFNGQEVFTSDNGAMIECPICNKHAHLTKSWFDKLDQVFVHYECLSANREE